MEKMSREREIDRISSYICRENLVIMGIPELTEKEDTEKVVKDFYQKNLKMGNDLIGEIEHQRVHRVPATTRPRPIKVRYLRYSDKVKVQQNGRQLKGTSFYIMDDLPKRVRQERSKQMPSLRAAREQGKLAFFSRAEPWKLVVIDKESEGKKSTGNVRRNTEEDEGMKATGNVRRNTEEDEGRKATGSVRRNTEGNEGRKATGNVWRIIEEDEGKKATVNERQNIEEPVDMEESV